MTRVYRRDTGTLTRAPVRTPEGFLRTSGRITRAGIFPYRRPDGTIRRELRRPEEVFRQESLASYAMAPVTLGHPRTPSGKVGPDNIRELQVGHAGDSITVDDPYVEAPLMITAADAIRAIESGVEQLSVGYDVDLIDVPGTWEGQDYDVEQRDITCNHIAIVPAGRAGPDVRLRADSAEQLEPDILSAESRGGATRPSTAPASQEPLADSAQGERGNVGEGGEFQPLTPGLVRQTDPLENTARKSVGDPDSMPRVETSSARRTDSLGGNVADPKRITKYRIPRFDELGNEAGCDEFDVEDDALGAVSSLAERQERLAKGLRLVKSDRDDFKTRLDAADQKNASLTTQLGEAQAAKTAAEARADSAETARKAAERARADAADPKVLSGVIRDRAELWGRASAVLGEAVRLDDLHGMEPLAIKREVVKKLVPDLAVSKVGNDSYVEARFDSEMERFEAENPNLALAATRVILDQNRRADAAQTEAGSNGDADKAYDRMERESANRWKNKPAKVVGRRARG